MKSETQVLPDISSLKDNFLIEHAWKALDLPGTPARLSKSPLREDKNPSFTIYDSGRRWKDWGTGDGGDAIDFIAKVLNVGNKDAIAAFRKMAGGEAPTTTASSTTTSKAKKTSPEEEERIRWKIAERVAVKSTLRLPTEVEMQIIADLRPKVSVRSVLHLTQDGHLKVGQWRNHPVFAIQFGDFFQIRRMDGEYFWPKDKGGKRELNMAESTPAFVCLRNNTPIGTRTIIAEGLIEILALIELEIRADDYRREHFPNSDYQPVAFAVASSAHSKINDVVLESLRCKSIRVVPDNDTAGHKAAQQWTDRLQAAGIHVDNRLMPIGKDLGDALPHMPDSACYHLLNF